MGLEGRKIIVTGGAGFIGSAVCRHLVGERGAVVLNIDKLTYAANLSSLDALAQDPNYALQKTDICDRTTIAHAFATFEPDAIIHLAAESHVDRSITGSGVFMQSNIIGTYTLLEATRGYLASADAERRRRFRFIHVSTDEVFGSLGSDGLFREDTAYDPSSPYSASKAASDHLVTAWHRTYGLPVIVSNCSNNYGPYQFPEKLIPTMFFNAFRGRPLPVYGDGGNVRDWLFVEDHARALALMLEHGRPGERYNVGGRNEKTNLEVVRQICALLDDIRPSGAPHHRLISFVADRPGHDRRYAIDASKIESELGWRARETFETGLAKTIRWYFENAEWWERSCRNGFDGERLGLIATADEPNVARS